MKKTCLLLLMLLLFVSIATAFEQETVKEDITGFEWSFLQPWGDDKESYKEFWNSYADNFGCEDITINVYYELDVLQKTESCTATPPYCTFEEVYDSKNDSFTTTETCIPQPDKCVMTDKHTKELYDLETGDYLIPQDSRIIIQANRKASSEGVCDLAFTYDDGTEYYDAKLGGELGISSSLPKVWWNNTWSVKYNISVNATTDYTSFPILFNDTLIEMDDCDLGDVRIVNATEDGVETFNITYWNNTHGLVYINQSLNWTGYLYCNATSPQTTTSVYLDTHSLDSTDYIFYEDWSAGYLAAKWDAEAGCGYNVTTYFGKTAMNITGTGTNSLCIHTDAIVISNDTAFQASVRTQEAAQGSVKSINNIGPYDTNAADYRIANFWSTEGSAVEGNWNYYNGAWETYGILEPTSSWQIFKAEVNPLDNLYDVTIDGSSFPDIKPNNLLWSTYLPKKMGLSGATHGGTGSIYYADIFVWNRTVYGGTAPTSTLYTGMSVGIGDVTENIVLTDITIGLFNSTWDDISNFSNEGEEIRWYANYSYLTNGSGVHPNGACNYSANNVITEQYQSNVGTNLTVCISGCDSTNQTFTFTGLQATPNQDVMRFKLCRDTTATNENFYVANNYSGSYTYDYDLIPYCPNGYVNFTVEDANASGTDLEVSIWSTAANTAKALVLVDSFGGVDRIHNVTSKDMVWNASLGLFISADLHEYYVHGSHLVNIDCIANVSSVENQTGNVLNITVANLPPTISIDSIWESITGFSSFVDDVSKKYPLLGSQTINITGGCQDDDLWSAGVNLTYENLTLIYSKSWLASDNQVPTSVNLTRTNFSTSSTHLSGALKYVFGGFCNDTTGNITTSTRSFTARNLAPTMAWTNTSPQIIGAVPITLNFTYTDPEGETGYHFIYINNTNMSDPNITTTTKGYVFSLGQNTWNISVKGNDTFFNSSTADMSVLYTQNCILSVFGVADDGRYRDTTMLVKANCSNNVALTSCSAEINHFTTETFVCAGENVTFELGKNTVNFSVVGNALQVDETVTFYAKKEDAVFADYFLLIMFAVFAFFLLWFVNSKYDVGIGHVLVIMSMGLIGWYLIALSLWMSVIIFIFAFLYTIYWLIR